MADHEVDPPGEEVLEKDLQVHVPVERHERVRELDEHIDIARRARRLASEGAEEADASHAVPVRDDARLLPEKGKGIHGRDRHSCP